jgi:hypothetical protein
MKRSQLTRRAAGWTDEAVRHIDAAGCDIAVVRRPPPVECGALVAGGTLGAVRFTTAARGAAAKIDRALARLDLVKPARQRAAVADDILSLVCGMLAVFSWLRVEVRLDLTDEQSCPKFHCDNVLVRLVTTYVGPGTEYVEMPAADMVHRVAPGSLVLLKGHRHPTHAALAILASLRWVALRATASTGPPGLPCLHADRMLHRSPPMRPGTRRFCVAIDHADWLTAAAPDPAPDHTGALA